jgi:hypothetical protein
MQTNSLEGSALADHEADPTQLSTAESSSSPPSATSSSAPAAFGNSDPHKRARDYSAGTREGEADNGEQPNDEELENDSACGENQ